MISFRLTLLISLRNEVEYTNEELFADLLSGLIESEVILIVIEVRSIRALEAILNAGFGVTKVTADIDPSSLLLSILHADSVVGYSILADDTRAFDAFDFADSAEVSFHRLLGNFRSFELFLACDLRELEQSDTEVESLDRHCCRCGILVLKRYPFLFGGIRIERDESRVLTDGRIAIIGLSAEEIESSCISHLLSSLKLDILHSRSRDGESGRVVILRIILLLARRKTEDNSRQRQYN